MVMGKKEIMANAYLSLVIFKELSMLSSYLILTVTQQVDIFIFLILQMRLRIVLKVTQLWKQGLRTGSLLAELY